MITLTTTLILWYLVSVYFWCRSGFSSEEMAHEKSFFWIATFVFGSMIVIVLLIYFLSILVITYLP